MAARLILVVLLILCAGSNANADRDTRYYVDVAVTELGSPERLRGASIEFKRSDWVKYPAIEQWSRPGHYYAELIVKHYETKQETFEITVRVNGYEPGTQKLILNEGDPTSQKVDITLKRTIRGQLVHVRVVRSDDDRRPINEARVRIGFEAGNTDPDGKITLQITDPSEKGTQLLELSQGFFESLTTPIPIKRYDDDAKQQFITCRLKPRDNNSAPPGSCDPGRMEPYEPTADPIALKLVVKVRDRSDRNMPSDQRPDIADAAVTVTKLRGETELKMTTAEGEAEFTLDPDRDREKNLTVKVVKNGYGDVTTFVPGTAMTPGPKPIRWFVELDKRDVIGEAIADSWAKINAAYRTVGEACSSLDTVNKTVAQYRVSALILDDGLNKFHKMVTTASQECLQVPSLRAQIESFASTAGQKESLLKARLDAANAIDCKTNADVKQLETLWNEILPLAWEVHLNAGKAEGINNRLKGIIARADALYARFDKADQDTPVPLSGIPQKMLELTTNFKTQRDNALTPCCDKVKEKKGELRKTIDNAIASIEGIAAGAGLSADPRVRSFRTQTVGLRPDDKKPCSEGESKLRIDQLIEQLEKEQKPTEKWVEDTKNTPLCNGQKTEDDLVAQAIASTQIIQYATDSNLPEKIRNCKVAVAGKPPAAVTPPKPGRTWVAFGIYPREITLAPGELKEFQAYLIWSDGTTEDISTRSFVRWTKGRQFRSAKEGTYYLTVKATLDQEREDKATIRVKAPLVIRGPAAAKVGEEVAAKAELTSPRAGVKYRYSWSLNEQALSGNDSSQPFRLLREGNNTLRAAAWRPAGNRWEKAAEASLVIYGQAAAPVQISIIGPDRVTVQDSPVNTSFEARLTPESPKEQYFYRWGATGPGGARTFNSQTRVQPIAARTPGTYDIQVNVWKYVNNTWLYVGKGSRPFTILQGTGTGRSYTSRPR